ncbi:ubiquitin carboxyl-terminal hydrolase [Pelagophyceae sp. CCMP2097]|nr:ubiquitin carboxyl-terminal hydrolase [Pelagophyceae sp. CCMP2097]
MASWCTIESDPGVFTELIEKVGVRGAEFAELYSLDDADFAQIAPVYGLVFLFKWTGEKDSRAAMSFDAAPPGLFYAKQVVANACATQAILSILLNVEDPRLEIGKTLTELKNFATELPYDMRGLAIENSEAVRNAHNAFARPEPFLAEQGHSEEGTEDVFHFVAYVPHADGRVYELDGLKGGPVDLGAVSDAETWLSVARAAIYARIEQYAASEIKFNLMAVVRDKRATLDDRLAAAVETAAACGEDVDAGAACAAEVADVEAERAAEDAKRAHWAQENVRRHHNFVPFAVDLLKVLAEKGKLGPLIQKGKERAAARPPASRG